MTHEQSPVLNTEQAAKYVGLSPTTMAKLRMRGGNVPHVKIGRRCLYRREDLDTWLEANRRTSTSDPGRTSPGSSQSDVRMTKTEVEDDEEAEPP